MSSVTPCFVGVPSMNSVCKYLLAEDRIKKQFQYQASVKLVGKQRWSVDRLSHTSGSSADAEEFDYIIAADRNSIRVDRKDFSDPSTTKAIRSFAKSTWESISSKPVLVAMVAFNKPLPPELGDILTFTSDRVLAQAVRDSAKPQRSRDDGIECWVLHSTCSHAKEIIRY